MADIARMAEVSVSTVSRALAGSHLVPAALQTKIGYLAREHGYVIDRSAQRLRLQTTDTIGLIVLRGRGEDQTFADPLILEILGHLLNEALSRGYDLLVSRIEEPGHNGLNELISSHLCDGIVVIGQRDQHDALNQISSQYLPMVVWGERQSDQTYCTIGIDNFMAGKIAAEFLMSMGHKCIRFLGSVDTPETLSRYNGYVTALQTEPFAHSNLDMGLIACGATHANAYAAMRNLLAENVPFDAILAASDVIANGAMRAFSDSGGKVPADCSFMGFDDIAMAQHLGPALTTVRQDLRVVAHVLVDSLLRRIAGELVPPQVLPAELVIRQSTGAR